MNIPERIHIPPFNLTRAPAERQAKVGCWCRPFLVFYDVIS